MADQGAEQKPRKRSLTSVTLQWIAEKIRRSERIKAEIEQGTYKVDSHQVAAALVNDERK